MEKAIGVRRWDGKEAIGDRNNLSRISMLNIDGVIVYLSYNEHLVYPGKTVGYLETLLPAGATEEQEEKVIATLEATNPVCEGARVDIYGLRTMEKKILKASHIYRSQLELKGQGLDREINIPVSLEVSIDSNKRNLSVRSYGPDAIENLKSFLSEALEGCIYKVGSPGKKGGTKIEEKDIKKVMCFEMNATPYTSFSKIHREFNGTYKKIS